MNDPIHDGATDPEPESVEARHLRSRIEERMFGREQAVRVGRFLVLEPLGRGGMGVVYLAYDPKLQRRVAVKVLSRIAADAQRRTLREATTLAQLNHPNVVTIHEVGEHGGEHFVAMEYVDGGTLRQWCLDHPEPTVARTRTVLTLLQQALEGLAAAHAVGVVHCDLKPGNMLIGKDGRLRLADFGLARSPGACADAGTTHKGTAVALTTLSTTASVAGTPAYMAPEQFDGESDERSDQFGLCASFFEALYGERPFVATTIDAIREAIDQGKIVTPRRGNVPAYLQRVLERGLRARPQDRHRDVGAVKAALHAGARRRQAGRWAAAAVGVVAVAAGVVGHQRYDLAQRTDACIEAGAAIDEVWNADARGGLRAGLVDTGLRFAPTVAHKVTPWIDAQAEEWREATTAACMKTRVDRTWPASRFDKAQWCLEDRRLELAMLVTHLAQADDQTVHKAVQAAAGLSTMDACLDETTVAGMPAPPEPAVRPRVDALRADVSRAAYLQSIGRFDEGLVLVRRALDQAQSVGWAPLTAAARLGEASLLEATGAYPASEAAGTAAYMQAARVGDWDVAASAANGLSSVVGYRQGRHPEGKTWAEHAALAIAYCGDPAGLREGRRLGNLGILSRGMGEHDAAADYFAAALAIQEDATGPEHPDYARLLNNLGNVHYSQGEYGRAAQMHERALAIFEAVLGSEHPHVGGVLSNLGTMFAARKEFDEAQRYYERALALREMSLGPEHPKVAHTLDNLGNVLASKGEYAAAKPLYGRALAILEATHGEEHIDLAFALNNLGHLHEMMGEYAQAKVLHTRALAIRETSLPPDHLHLASSLQNLGITHARLQEYDLAQPLFDRAVAIKEKALGPEDPRLASALSDYGELFELRGDPQKARALYQRALDIRLAALGPEHPDVASSLTKLGNVLASLGEPALAAEYRERAASVR